MLWNQCVQNGQTLRFALQRMDAEDKAHSEKLHFHSYDVDTLKMLRRLALDAERLLEERGYNLLRLCWGSVHWRTETASGVAPLILIPTQLQVAPHRSSAVLSYTGDPVQVNPAILEILRQECKVEQLVIPHLDDDLSDSNLEEVQELIEAIQGYVEHVEWKITESYVLDLLDSTNLQVVDDLHLDNWTPIHLSRLDGILGKGFGVELVNQALSEAHVKREVCEQEFPTILDADPAQMAAISVASLGGDLVVQGPPGTGKSQTIANMLAHFVAQGKRILFVAQKKAALDVVVQRLEQANLKHVLLELHSTKSKRSDLLKSLRDAYHQPNVKRQRDVSLPEKLQQIRTQIEVETALLQKPIGKTGLRLSELFSAEERTRSFDIQCIQHFPMALDWSEFELQSLEDRSIELAELVSTEQLPWKSNPFRSMSLSSLHSSALAGGSLEEKFVLCRQLRFELEAVLNECHQQRETIGLAVTTTISGLQDLSTELQFLAKQPDLSKMDTELLLQLNKVNIARDLLTRGQVLADSQARLLTIFEPTSLFQVQEVLSTSHALQVLQSKWWKVLLPKWWRLTERMKVYLVNKKETEFTTLEFPLQELESLHHKVLDFEEQAEWGGRIFQSEWKGFASDWADLHQKLDWFERLQGWSKLHPDIQLKQILQQSELRQKALNIQQQLDSHLLNITNLVQQISDWLQPLPQSVLALTSTTDIQHLLAWVSDINFTHEALARSVAIRQVCVPFIEFEMTSWMNWVEQQQDFMLIRKHWRYSVYRSRRDLLLQRAEVHHLTRSTLQSRRKQYVALDQQFPFYQQEKLVEAHVQDTRALLPIGQMRILSEELSRKRGTRSIRRLMRDCGAAIQRLKPIFMMSPMSVASNLPPKDIHFDVVIFDEASQLTMPFALGSILRAKQSIVVGDIQQLSPTNFFTGEGEVESILERFSSRGCPSIQLSFHYRSRHPDLIAISNRFMYDSKLRPFPSPFTHPLATGVRIVSTVGTIYDRGKSRTNSGEAELVIMEMMLRVRAAISKGLRPSFGIVAFSTAQRDALQDTWDRLGRSNPDVVKYFEGLPNGEGLFIKNLESVQGDERDCIFISVGYGLDAKGLFSQGFGPVTQSGGERRLNVLFSRARYEMLLFANFDAEHIKADTLPRQMLKEMLSLGQTSRHTALESLSVLQADANQKFVQDVCAFIRSEGFEVQSNFGPTGNKIDIVVVDPQNPTQYHLAILCENVFGEDGGLLQESTRYRERLFANILRGFGWDVYTIWSLPWYVNPEAERNALSRRLRMPISPSLNEPLFHLQYQERRMAQSLNWRRRQFFASEDVPITLIGQNPKTYPIGLGDLIEQVLEVEGPLSDEMLAKRIVTLLQVSSSSQNRVAISSLVQGLLKQGLVYEDEGFYWAQGTPEGLVLPNGLFREPTELYPPHLLQLMQFYLRSSVTSTLPVNEMIELLLEQLGWQVITQKRRQDFERLLHQRVQGSPIQIVDGVFYLNL